MSDNRDYDARIEENAEQLAEAFRTLAQAMYEAVKDVWNKIKEFINSHKEIINSIDHHTEIPKVKFHVPMKILSSDQVLNRKPLMAVARSRC